MLEGEQGEAWFEGRLRKVWEEGELSGLRNAMFCNGSTPARWRCSLLLAPSSEVPKRATEGGEALSEIGLPFCEPVSVPVHVKLEMRIGEFM